LRAEPIRVFRLAVALAFFSALLLVFAPSASLRNISMFLLGASLAPTYPLVLAGFFARTTRTADSRWILFTAGFGGSVLPWIAGFTSTHTGSLRTGMLIIPAALLLMALLLPTLREPPRQPALR
jgi:fucose permease